MTPRPSTVALLLFFAATMLFFSMFAPQFASAGNMENLLSGFSFLAILAMGQAFPILVRGIDLSVGAIVALAGMVIFDLTVIFGWPGYVVIPLALATATFAGALNGVLVVVMRLPPFIATLATLATYRGIVYAISGRQLFPSLATTPIRDPWITGLETYFDIGSLTGISAFVRMPWLPLSFFVMLGLLALLQAVLVTTRFGRDIYAVGGNGEAARLAGINVGRVTVVAFAISGFCAGVAALFLVARLTTSTEQLGTGMELNAIAAAVIGGVSLQGGTGTVFGPAVGAFLLGAVLIGLTLLGISQFVQQILTGAILLAAVGGDRLVHLRRHRGFAASLVG